MKLSMRRDASVPSGRFPLLYRGECEVPIDQSLVDALQRRINLLWGMLLRLPSARGIATPWAELKVSQSWAIRRHRYHFVATE